MHRWRWPSVWSAVSCWPAALGTRSVCCSPHRRRRCLPAGCGTTRPDGRGSLLADGRGERRGVVRCLADRAHRGAHRLLLPALPRRPPAVDAVAARPARGRRDDVRGAGYGGAHSGELRCRGLGRAAPRGAAVVRGGVACLQRLSSGITRAPRHRGAVARRAVALGWLCDTSAGGVGGGSGGDDRVRGPAHVPARSRAEHGDPSAAPGHPGRCGGRGVARDACTRSTPPRRARCSTAPSRCCSREACSSSQ
jgi:hypothetical protein